MTKARADLLVELIQEEIPARMQARAAADLLRMFTERFSAASLTHGQMHSFVAPRHLALYVEGLAVRQPDSIVEKRGPRVDAPQQAIDGFLKSTGLAREDLVTEETPKGTFLFARTEMKGAPTRDLLAAMVTSILTEFPWPKSQRWGATRFRWVRPLHRINVIFDGAGLAGCLDLGGEMLAFTTASTGHYFEAPDDLDLVGIDSAAAYGALLGGAHVVVDQAARITAIRSGAEKIAAGLRCRLRTNAAKISEVAGLVEQPHLLSGRIEDRFMQLPGEVLQSSIETHQKYITLEAADGTLSPHFIVVSNRKADAKRDVVIIAGNQRVLRARLVDAEFFWQEDGKTPLADFLPQLAKITFYEGLGTVYDKAVRLQKLAADIAPFVAAADGRAAARAGLLAKADLVTGMVGEFPELQGIMGGYYAARTAFDGPGEDAAVATAISDHYRPQGPDDAVPATPEALVVALADKIDTLVGFFGVGAKPTGSKDPFALRRAALGVIRILIESKTRLPVTRIFQAAAGHHGFDGVNADLDPFMRERLRVSLREGGIAHDIVAAAFGDDSIDDFLLLADRAAALAAFIDTETGAGLMAGWRRAASILKSEESKDKQVFSPKTDPSLFSNDAEAKLFDTTKDLADGAAATAQEPEDLMALMQSLGELRVPIDQFFDQVVVNDDNPRVRENRLGLLALVRAKMLGVADFSKLEG